MYNLASIQHEMEELNTRMHQEQESLVRAETALETARNEHKQIWIEVSDMFSDGAKKVRSASESLQKKKKN